MTKRDKFRIALAITVGIFLTLLSGTQDVLWDSSGSPMRGGPPMPFGVVLVMGVWVTVYIYCKTIMEKTKKHE